MCRRSIRSPCAEMCRGFSLSGPQAPNASSPLPRAGYGYAGAAGSLLHGAPAHSALHRREYSPFANSERHQIAASVETRMTPTRPGRARRRHIEVGRAALRPATLATRTCPVALRGGCNIGRRSDPGGVTGSNSGVARELAAQGACPKADSAPQPAIRAHVGAGGHSQGTGMC